LISLPFRFFVVDRWQHSLVLDLAESSSDQGTDVLFRDDQGGDSQKWHVVGDVDPDMIHALVF
jgi:transcription elongation GreA/GreB family factor